MASGRRGSWQGELDFDGQRPSFLGGFGFAFARHTIYSCVVDKLHPLELLGINIGDELPHVLLMRVGCGASHFPGWDAESNAGGAIGSRDFPIPMLDHRERAGMMRANPVCGCSSNSAPRGRN